MVFFFFFLEAPGENLFSCPFQLPHSLLPHSKSASLTLSLRSHFSDSHKSFSTFKIHTISVCSPG